MLKQQLVVQKREAGIVELLKIDDVLFCPFFLLGCNSVLTKSSLSFWLNAIVSCSPSVFNISPGFSGNFTSYKVMQTYIALVKM